MVNKDKGINLEKTFKQGLGGGILGAFVGAPGLGMAIGVLHANKDKVKQFANDVDDSIRPQRKQCRCNNQRPKKSNPMDDPAAYF